jgi:dTDP-4-dehydrorhamnose reductase
MNDHKFLILGANGQLGKEFKKELTTRKLHVAAPDESECNITDFDGIANVIEGIAPTHIINCAAYNAVDDAEAKPDLAHLINSKAVEHLARVCKQNGIFFVHYSSDYVFDGRKGELYSEVDTPNPLNVYGKSKLAGEAGVRENLDEFLIFRTSWVFGDGTQNFIHKLLAWASKNRVLKLTSDEVSVPTSTHDLVSVTLLALQRKLKGVYHLTNSGYASRYEWGRYVLQLLKKDNVVIPVPMAAFQTAAQRPGFSAMSNKRISESLGVQIPDWKEAVSRYLEIISKDLR